jgi:hypothetical protein
VRLCKEAWCIETRLWIGFILGFRLLLTGCFPFCGPYWLVVSNWIMGWISHEQEHLCEIGFNFYIPSEPPSQLMPYSLLVLCLPCFLKMDASSSFSSDRTTKPILVLVRQRTPCYKCFQLGRVIEISLPCICCSGRGLWNSPWGYGRV